MKNFFLLIVLCFILTVSYCLAQTGPSVTISWTASPTPNVTYNIYRATGNCPAIGVPTTVTKINSSQITGLSYLDTAVTYPNTYCYYGTAQDANGVESVPSNTAQAVMLPRPPSSLKVTITQ